MAKSLQRAGLVAELATATGLSKEAVNDLLDKYTAIAYREAPNGFVIPGICKLSVVTKKASRCRNPATGQWLMIGERQALKIVPIKKAKDTIAPRPPDLIKVMAVPPPPKPEPAKSELPPVFPEPPTGQVAPTVAEERQSQATESATTQMQAAPTPPAGQQQFMDKGEGQIVFNCSGCGSMLAAAPSTGGMMGECPFCGGKTPIPGGDKPQLAPKPAYPSQNGSHVLADFITFVCRECGQEIEAPVDMIGMEVNCPTCASILHVPAFSEPLRNALEPEHAEQTTNRTTPPPGVNPSSMTIRIDLSDLE